MKKTIVKILALMIAASVVLQQNISVFAADAPVVYVSPNGDDSASGNADSPLGTLKAAAELLTQKQSETGKKGTVILREGRYTLKDRLFLDESCSGMTFKAYDGERAVVSAATPIKGSMFTKVCDKEFLSRIPFSARNGIYSVKFDDVGIKNLGEIKKVERHNQLSMESSPILTLNGVTKPVACWPNSGYTEISECSEENGVYTFKTPENRADGWKDMNDVWAYGTFEYDYADDSIEISNYDKATGAYTTSGYLVYGMKKGGKIKFINVPEEMDMPGEWYADRDTRTLYIYSEDDLSNSELTYCTDTDGLVYGENTSDITFEGIEFEGTCSAAITFKSSSNITVRGCEFKNIGRQGVYTSGCENVTIDGCTFRDLGKGGAYILGGGDKATLTSSGNRITDCTFERFSEVGRRYCHAIQISGVGTVVSHNNIHNSPHAAISFTGNNHIIEYNDIWDVLEESSDAGAIYSGRSWVNGGSEIRYNYLHDMSLADGNTWGKSAIYLDDAMADVDIYGNVFRNVNVGIALHSAEYNNIYNNVFADIQYRAVNMNNLDTMTNERLAQENDRIDYWYSSGTLVENYNSLYSKMHDLISGYYEWYDEENEVWNNAFPYLKTIISEGNAVAPKHNSICNNVIFLGEDTSKQSFYLQGLAESLNTIENNSEVYRTADITPSGGINDTELFQSTFKDGFTGLNTGETGSNTVLESELSDFGLLYPQNGSQNVPAEGLILSWDGNSGADRYEVTVATDPRLENKVFTSEVETPYIKAGKLSYDMTYYWAVKAISSDKNISDGKREKMNEGGIYSFGTLKCAGGLEIHSVVFLDSARNEAAYPVKGELNIAELMVLNRRGEERKFTAELSAYNSDNLCTDTASVENICIGAGGTQIFGMGVPLADEELAYIKISLYENDSEVYALTIPKQLKSGDIALNKLELLDKNGQKCGSLVQDDLNTLNFVLKNYGDKDIDLDIRLTSYDGDGNEYARITVTERAEAGKLIRIGEGIMFPKNGKEIRLFVSDGKTVYINTSITNEFLTQYVKSYRAAELGKLEIIADGKTSDVLVPRNVNNIRFTLKNTSGDKSEGMILTAIYDSAGILQSVKQKNFTAEENEETEFSVTVLPKNDGDYVKLFVIDYGLAPCMDSIRIDADK